MEEIILNKQQFQSPPFGLHDAVITEMRMKDETVVLGFKDGITVNREPYEKTGPAVIEIRNVDPDFCDSLDGLIFLKYSDFPQKTIRAILRGLPDELKDEVWMRFYGTPRTE